MIAIGIDIGKFKHCAAVYESSSSSVLVKPFFFDNNRSGFLSLLETVGPFSESAVFAMEDTGHYSQNLIAFLVEKDFHTVLINPVTTDSFRKSKLKSTKTDRTDAVLIAQVYAAGLPSRTITKKDLLLKDSKQYARMHHDVKEEENRLKNQLQKELDIVFPEYNSLFKTKYSRPYMDILKEFPSARSLAGTDIRNIRKVVNAPHKGRKVSLSAEDLKNLAKKSIGLDSPSAELNIRFLIQKIEMLQEQLAEIDKKIEELSTELNSPIFSIPGIGAITGVTLLGECQDISKFSNAAKLISYFGMDPYQYQSGIYQSAHGRLSKHGSKYARKSLYQAIMPVIRFEPAFHAYYTKKREEGKSHRCAQGHAVRKLLRVIYHLCTQDIPYQASSLL